MIIKIHNRRHASCKTGLTRDVHRCGMRMRRCALSMKDLNCEGSENSDGDEKIKVAMAIGVGETALSAFEI